MFQLSYLLLINLLIVSGKQKFKHSRAASSLIKQEKSIHSQGCEGFIDASSHPIHDINKMYRLGTIHHINNNPKAAKSCLLHAVTSPDYTDSNDHTHHIAHGLAWTNLASYYQDYFKDDHKATICFDEAAARTGLCASHIHAWDLIGPFPIGKTEIDGDPLATYGGITGIPRADNSKYFSELVVGGEVGWSRVVMNPSTSQIDVTFRQVRWNSLVQSLGRLVLEWQAWLVGDWHVNADGVYIVHCKGVHTVYFDDQWLIGDQYHTGHTFSSVKVSRGIHQIRIRFRKVHQGSFSCEFQHVDAPLRIFSPSFLPDVVGGILLTPLISVPLVNNLDPNYIVNDIIFRVTPSNYNIFSVNATLPWVPSVPASGQLIYIPVKLIQKQNKNQCPPAFNLEAVANAINLLTGKKKIITTNTIKISLRCRKIIGESFLFTFLDHDGSVNAAGAIAPFKPCVSGKKKDSCPIVISMGGTGVKPDNMADSYKRMNKKKKWIFGVANAWLLTPTRHGAHNWEQMGMRTALSSLSALTKLTYATDIDQSKVYKVFSKRHGDITRVVIAGHSMGGHGAWEVASHYPDIALCVVPAAGWIIKENYGESNRMFELDISTSHADSILKGIFASAVIENNADLFVSNLAGIPILIRVGSDDKSVHPWFSRRMYRLLKEINYLSFNRTHPNPAKVTLSEIRGKEHWFWDTRRTNDGGVINDAEMRKFLKGCIQKELPTLPPIFSLTTHNPASFSSRGGLRILQLSIPYRLGKIKVIRSKKKWLLTTQNIQRFSVLAVQQLLDNMPTDGFTIDKYTHFSQQQIQELLQPVTEPTKRSKLSLLQKPHFFREDSGWRIQIKEDSLHQRGPDSYGPIRQVFDLPYIVVYGTIFNNGTASQRSLASTYRWSAVHLANLHAMASEAYVRVLSDTQMMQLMQTSSFESHSYNYVLFGGPESNSFTKYMYGKGNINDHVMPVKFYAPDSQGHSSFSIGSCNYNLPTHGVIFLTPFVHTTKDITLAVILEGLGVSGLKAVLSLATPTIPPMTRSPFNNMVPDYVVADPEIFRLGLPGILAAGYWDNNWSWQKHLSYTTLCNHKNDSVMDQ